MWISWSTSDDFLNRWAFLLRNMEDYHWIWKQDLQPILKCAQLNQKKVNLWGDNMRNAFEFAYIDFSRIQIPEFDFIHVMEDGLAMIHSWRTISRIFSHCFIHLDLTFYTIFYSLQVFRFAWSHEVLPRSIIIIINWMSNIRSYKLLFVFDSFLQLFQCMHVFHRLPNYSVRLWWWWCSFIVILWSVIIISYVALTHFQHTHMHS